jgi:transcription elongation factor GreA
MADDRIPMTRDGYEKVKAELAHLHDIKMIEVTKRVAAARDLGDLSENAEYHAAREQQGFIEGRINEIEHALSHCEIIDVTVLPATKRVVFGATVELADQDDGTEMRYQIVGEFEADARLGLISISSPIARALVGKSAGDVVEVAVPGGLKAYEIVTVRYA